ncbi:DegV family protein [Sporosarcina sp. E16_8]|uniref:DAK2 domain-containing protein n=1 Tax=Sporosarcina sp. E16_8 TaxID=2789295 RepID=UPI001A923306|nr:DegV family protein [Sporosarcina sp. E16_8]MBO0587143.1 DegV family EDD domain-containing protein [Sporosarcina sp. E16_8]
MNSKYLDSEKLYYAFVSGANMIIKQKNELNRINVFPVADSDTGTNLAFTMQTIIEETKMKGSAKQTMGSIADAALTGARGNSGIIFAQFMNGLHLGLDDEKEITLTSFSEAVECAVIYAYKSISNPVEGTIISVMKDWSNSLNLLKDRVTDFTQLFTISLEAATQSLKSTPEKLRVLRDASVVDAGAKGFVYFIEGITHYLLEVEIEDTDYISADVEYEDSGLHSNENTDLRNRYCTEALIKGEQIDLEMLRNNLVDLGESLIVAGSPNKVKVHIHTNHPEILFDRLRGVGVIIQQKADDMVRQFESVHSRKHKIAIVTDSIADLPKNLMDKHQIHMIPLNLLVGDSSYLDKITISPTYLYETMDDAKNYPTSSQPTVKAVESYLKSIVPYYESIIVITVSKKMSGTYDTVFNAAKKIDSTGEKIVVIDSKLNSGGQGLVVLKAAEAIEKDIEFTKVIKLIYDTIEKTKIFVSVDTLKYMVRSGRVKKYTGLTAKIMNLKPVVSINNKGDGIIIGKALSVKANTKKMQALVQEIARTKKIVSYSIVHANAIGRANEYERIFTPIMGRKPEYITEISSIVAMNAGVGCVAIALTTD